jgi:hypothetical protein
VETLVLGAEPGPFLVAVALGALGTLIAFLGGFHALRRARVIEDTPTALARSAPQGYVELEGRARMMPGPQIICPLTRSHCVWWWYQVELRSTYVTHGRSRASWQVVERHSSDDLFLLEDSSGDCVIDPYGARVHPGVHRRWYGPEPRPLYTPTRNTRGWIGFGRYRYTERLIRINDPLYAIGKFRTQSGNPELSDHRHEVRELLAEWKRDQAELLRRFDADGDGRISLDEWEAVRRAALEEVHKRHLEQGAKPDVNVLSKPRDGRPFILSAIPQDLVARNYRIVAAVALLLALACGTLTVWALELRWAT